MADDALDFLILILVLSVCVALGFGVVIPLLNDHNMGYQTELVDKSALQLSGSDQNDSTYDGTLSRKEVILMTQVQDYSMPYPRRLTTPTLAVNITSLYKLDVIGYGTKVNNDLKDDTDSTGYSEPRYAVNYSYGVVNILGDESYAIVKKP